jgi:hypothetical protein
LGRKYSNGLQKAEGKGQKAGGKRNAGFFFIERKD